MFSLKSLYFWSFRAANQNQTGDLGTTKKQYFFNSSASFFIVLVNFTNKILTKIAHIKILFRIIE